MIVTAHIIVSKGYSRGINCYQSIDDALVSAEESNKEHYGHQYLTQDKDRAVVTVEFEVPDSVFKREISDNVIQAIKA